MKKQLGYSKPLDDYEKKLEEFLNKGEFETVENEEKSFTELQEAAKNYLRLQKSKPITLRVKQENLIKFKARAKNVGIPYQRIINTFIDLYGNNKIRLAI